MIEIDSHQFPDSEIHHIRERRTRRHDKDGKPDGYETTWTVEPKEGMPIQSAIPPNWYQTIPNTTGTRVLIVTDLSDDEDAPARFVVAERPVIAWKVDTLRRDYEFDAGDPLFCDSIASNQMWCLFDPTTGQAWEIEGFSADTREQAIEVMQAELITRSTRRAERAEREAQKRERAAS